MTVALVRRSCHQMVTNNHWVFWPLTITLSCWRVSSGDQVTAHFLLASSLTPPSCSISNRRLSLPPPPICVPLSFSLSPTFPLLSTASRLTGLGILSTSTGYNYVCQPLSTPLPTAPSAQLRLSSFLQWKARLHQVSRWCGLHLETWAFCSDLPLAPMLVLTAADSLWFCWVLLVLHLPWWMLSQVAACSCFGVSWSSPALECQRARPVLCNGVTCISSGSKAVLHPGRMCAMVPFCP